jgi:hypothetical protein
MTMVRDWSTSTVGVVTTMVVGGPSDGLIHTTPADLRTFAVAEWDGPGTGFDAVGPGDPIGSIPYRVWVYTLEAVVLPRPWGGDVWRVWIPDWQPARREALRQVTAVARLVAWWCAPSSEPSWFEDWLHKSVELMATYDGFAI